MNKALHIGLLINPLAGLGGSLGLKGSDGEEVRALVRHVTETADSRAQGRAVRALGVLQKHASLFVFSCGAGAMGESALQSLGISPQVDATTVRAVTTAEDTRCIADNMVAAGIDVLVFVGGDGTARDIQDAIGDRCPVIGIPAGVKMHSGVFAVSPEAAAELLVELASGQLVEVKPREVRDIDEEAFRRGIVRSRFYGVLQVPGEGRFMQHTKVGGREDPDLVTAEIAAWQAQEMKRGHIYCVGPGSTTAALMEQLGLPNTLLGVDVVRDGMLLLSDANEAQLLTLLLEEPGVPSSIVVTVIGGQGYVFGRGNQQISAAVIERIGVDNIIILAAKSKISALEGRPLLVDTNDTALDARLSGLHQLVTGYDDHILYRLSPA